MEQNIFVIDASRCVACCDCFIACKDEFVDHAWLPYSEAQPDMSPSFIQVEEVERGQFPKVKVCYIPQPCMQCEDPPCIKPLCKQACPAGIDIPRYIRLVQAGKMKLDGIITHEFKLDEINQAIELIRVGDTGRIIINME